MISLLCLFIQIFYDSLVVSAANPWDGYNVANSNVPPSDHFDVNSRTFQTELVKYPAKIKPPEKTIIIHFGAKRFWTIIFNGREWKSRYYRF
jgi:hypothetical protein